MTQDKLTQRLAEIRNEIDYAKALNLRTASSEFLLALVEEYQKALNIICDDIDSDTHIPKRKIAKEALARGQELAGGE